MPNRENNKIAFVFFFITSLLIATSCGDNKDLSSPNDVVPLDIVALSTSPTAVDLDTARFDANGRTTVNFRIRIKLSQGQLSPLYQVRFSLQSTAANATPIELNVISTTPSQSDPSEVFSVASARLSRAQQGTYTIAAFIENLSSGRAGQNARQKISILDSRASAPQLVGVNSPDTVRIPASGTSLIQITATATSPNSASFIRDVLATRTDNRNITFQLLDDGDRNGLSGDQTAGDGIFTATLQVPSTNTPATRTFDYQAIDRNDLRSNIITRTIVFTR